MKKILIFMLVLLFSIGFVYYLIDANNVSKKLDEQLNALLNEFHEQVKLNPDLMLSSNPYDYTEGNKAYKDIVALGYKALPAIKEKIDKSENNGLQEYILAIAAEEIAKVDLKGDNYNWQTGKGWAREWDKYLKNLHVSFEAIMKSQDESARLPKIIKLGTPAIPLIIEKISEGHKELIPALEALAAGNDKIRLEQEDKQDIMKWIRKNKKEFDILRNLIDNNTNAIVL